MAVTPLEDYHSERITLRNIPTPAKVLVTCMITTLALGMLGALGQVIIHDIIPTLFVDSASSAADEHGGMPEMNEALPPASGNSRGDLFADLADEEKTEEKPFYKDDRFVWTLKWSHIHLFGINMIFIILGSVTLLLDAGSRLRAWLIALPFVGVLIDILAMWLKAFISPIFFWLHIPGGGVFAVIFAYVFLRAFWEMWIKPEHKNLL